MWLPTLNQVKWIVIVSLLLCSHFYAYHVGKSEVQNAWDKEKAASQLQEKTKQNTSLESTVKVVTQYVDRVKVVKEKGDTIVKEVPKYVSSSECVLSGGFRVLHDSAATNEVPDSSKLADAKATNAQDVATVMVENYNTYYQVKQQLESLQQWVKDQEDIYNK